MGRRGRDIREERAPPGRVGEWETSNMNPKERVGLLGAGQWGQQTKGAGGSTATWSHKGVWQSRTWDTSRRHSKLD
jgi:hypothetical protein